MRFCNVVRFRPRRAAALTLCGQPHDSPRSRPAPAERGRPEWQPVATAPEVSVISAGELTGNDLASTGMRSKATRAATSVAGRRREHGSPSVRTYLSMNHLWQGARERKAAGRGISAVPYQAALCPAHAEFVNSVSTYVGSFRIVAQEPSQCHPLSECHRQRNDRSSACLVHSDDITPVQGLFHISSRITGSSQRSTNLERNLYSNHR